MMNRMWMVAIAPLVLMAALLFGFYVVPSFENTVSLVTCVLVLAGSVLTGLAVLCVVFAGWLRGTYQLKRGEILAATMFASLDVLIPTAFALLVWMILRDWQKTGGILLF